METVKGSVVARELGSRDEWAEHREFLRHETTLHDSIMADTYHYIFVKTYRMYSIKNEP